MRQPIRIVSLALALGLAPVAALAADTSGDGGTSAQVKGPPNADGAQQKQEMQGEMSKSGASSASGANGAASAKATGASGDTSK